MKRLFRQMAAFLAFCVLAAAVPPAGLAAETAGELDIESMVNNASDGAVLSLTGNARVEPGGSTAKTIPWIISKGVTIQGNGHSIDVYKCGILLGADVTFENVVLNLIGSDGRNAIIVNGHALTLDDVTTGNLPVSVFGGTLLPADAEKDYFTVPNPDGASTINIQGTTDLRGSGRYPNFGSANIFAGSLSMGTFGENIGEEGDGKESHFQHDVTINIADCANSSALGTIYAGGGQNRTPYGASEGKVMLASSNKYRVDGTVTINGTNMIPNVDGEGADTTDVVYRGDNDPAAKTFQGISSLSVKSGNLELNQDSYFRSGGALSLSSGAKLDLKAFKVTTLDGVGSYRSDNGFVFLDKEQTWKIDGQVSGTTKVVIGSLSYDGTNSMTLPTAGHPYISAPNSSGAIFQLLPYSNQPDMTLENDGRGNWTATGGSPGETINRVTSFQIIPDAVTISMTDDAEIEMEASFEGVYLSTLDFIPLAISVNGGAELPAIEDQENPGYYIYTYQSGMLRMTVMDDTLCVAPDRQYSADTYKIQVTIPAKYNGAGQTLTDSAALTVTGGGVPDPDPVSIDIPKANPGLRWTGEEQTGVNEGAGYTLTGHMGTAVGEYTAAATLQNGYQWTSGSTDPQTIKWSIAKAGGPAAPGSLSAAAPTAENGTDGRITGTTSAMEYDTKETFPNPQPCGDGSTGGLAAGTYYVRAAETVTHEPGAYTFITVPASGAPTVTGVSVSSTDHKTEYKVGDVLDVTNLTIDVAYSDGTSKTVSVTENMVGGFDSSRAAANQILTITHEGHTAAYAIRITVPEVPGKPKYQVTLNNLGDGGSGGGFYEAGSTVTIRAGSKSGFKFSSWQPTGVELSSRFSPEVSFQMPNNDVVLLVTWRRDDGTAPPSHTHVWGSAWKSNAAHHWHDCTASGCTVADNSLKDGYAAHAAGEWVVDQPASSSQSGTRHRSCTVCGYEMARETIPATGGGSSSGGSSSSGSSSGGSSSSSTTTVKNPDGSTTATNTNKTTGTVTETTRRPDGSKLVVETKKDGTITTTDTAKDGSTVKTVARPDGFSETTVKRADGLTASVREDGNGARADVRLPSKAVQESQSGGGAVTLPIPALPGANAFVTVRTGSVRPVRVEIPARGDENTTVACLVHGDGTETILKTAVLTGGQITVSIPDGATVRLRDNGRDFRDTRGHWAEDAIDFAASRELFAGKTSTAFMPDAPMSRAMLTAVLARLDGVNAAGGAAYEKGMAWAVAQGVSDGRNPEGQVTREQLAAMLYRYTGSPAATDRELHFSDEAAISGYAREAVRWAAENGILSGYGNGAFAPGNKATRAQAAVVLTRYVNYLNGQ